VILSVFLTLQKSPVLFIFFPNFQRTLFRILVYGFKVNNDSFANWVRYGRFY